jgi:hypothetical protein
MKSWNDQITTYLKTQVPENLSDLQADQGPKVEIEFWGRRYVLELCVSFVFTAIIT